MAERSASSSDQKTERLAAELRVAEYKSVRDEWMSSRDAHQHTLQWTLAAIAVLFAGILTSKIRYQQPELYVGLVGAAGLIATFSQAIWFGEVMRMERAAMFLRGVEVAASRLTQTLGAVPPLSWETWRGSPPEKSGDPWVGPAALQILACFCLYLVLAGVAFTILVLAASDSKIPSDDQHFAAAAAVIVGLGYLLVTSYMGWMAVKIWRQKGKAPNLALPHRDSPEVYSVRQKDQAETGREE